MKRILTIFAAVFAAICTAGPVAQLMRPRDGSPTMLPDPRTTHGFQSFDIGTGWFGGEGCTGVTAVIWAKARKLRENAWMPFVCMSCTYESARTQGEGGEGLPELGTARLDTPLTLTGGSWGETCLPATYDYPPNLKSYQHGCYAINMISDCPVTVSVGGAEVYFPTATNVVRNIIATSADRSVIVTAESAAATVRFAIAENPLKQFVGGQSDAMARTGAQDLNPERGGMVEEEYRMFVLRAAIIGGTNMAYEVAGYDTLARLQTVDSGLMKMDRPRADFERDSRVRVVCCCMTGLDLHDISRWGFKIFDGWRSDSFIDTVKMMDIEEMQRRGIVFPSLDPDFAVVKASVRATVDTSTVVQDDEEMKLESQTATTTFVADISVEPGANNLHGWTTENYILTASEGGTVSNAVLTVTAGGTYTLSATDPIGNTATGIVTISSPHSQTQTKLTARGYPAGTWSADSSAAVLAALRTATTDGQIRVANGVEYKRWRAKRLVGMPTVCWAATGNHAKHAISPHVVASAKHYTWFSSSTLTFEDEDGNTGTVGTPSQMTSLSDWAAEHGFTAEEIAGAGIDDLVVCTTTGTIPSGCCPWFIPGTNAFASVYRGFGVLGWCSTQTDLGWGIPCLVRPEQFGGGWLVPRDYPYKQVYQGAQALTPYIIGGLLPEDYAMQTAEYWMFAPTYSGDSAHPIYLEHNGKMILVGNHRTVSGGTCYVKGYEILKAFVESVGDELKTVETGDAE